MAKYSFEFKKKVVEAYLQGEGGENYLASKFNVASPRQIKVFPIMRMVNKEIVTFDTSKKCIVVAFFFVL